MAFVSGTRFGTESKFIYHLADLPQVRKQNQLDRRWSDLKVHTEYQCIFFLTIGRSYHPKERLRRAQTHRLRQAQTHIRTKCASELNDLEGRAMRFVRNDR